MAVRWWVRLLQDRLLLVVFAVVLTLDQVSKQVVGSYLAAGASIPEKGLVRLTLVTNSGSAFGLFRDQTLFLILASYVGIGILLYFYRAHPNPGRLVRFSLALQLGGALGNLVDRLRLGYVRDFIDLGWWPVFNLADSSIVVGIILLGIVVLYRDARRPRGQEPPAPEETKLTPLQDAPVPPPEPPGEAH